MCYSFFLILFYGMLKASVGPLEYAEMNGLNEESIRFAKYFFSIDFNFILSE